MKIKLFHRKPLPGSSGVVLRGRVDNTNVLMLEAQGLFETVLRRLTKSLLDPLTRLINSPSEGELLRAYEDVIEATISAAAVGHQTGANDIRVMCPLCGGGPNSSYEGKDGFVYPLGLQKHLTGHQRAYECPVLSAARRHACGGLDNC